ncbi:movement protein [Brugmansia mild mottle virus]|uniref:Movement protein n=1 Tax=Brugmansia mild mottle virus TaxID=402399 RepID=Q0E5F3_9VIRU|nr:movement protein [Brugmansia mild mottle virus]CAL39165.1 30 kDa movement protein [Brugmansia mild mottle virus]
MTLSIRDSFKIDEFINLSKVEKAVPALFSRVKTVRVSTVDKIMATKNDSLSDVDLLKGVKLVNNGYVCLVGLVVSGEWNLPDNCKGGVSVCLVDKRMKRANEATLGSYHSRACKKNFSFKLIPNYSITTADAEKQPWQVLVNIRGVQMEQGYCPLSLEFVSVCIVHKNNVRKGLRERITNVAEGGSLELTEEVVESFVNDVPMAVRLNHLRNGNKKEGFSKGKYVNNNAKERSVNKFVKKSVNGKGGLKVKEISTSVEDYNSSEVSSDSFI